MRADVWAVWSLDGGRRLQKCKERTVVYVAALSPDPEDPNARPRRVLNDQPRGRQADR